jgi:hypothetical protein
LGAVFDRAYDHLNDGGIFIFDINAERQLASLNDRPPWVHWFGADHLLVMDMRPSETECVVIWGFRVFEHQHGGRYLLAL